MFRQDREYKITFRLRILASVKAAETFSMPLLYHRKSKRIQLISQRSGVICPDARKNVIARSSYGKVQISRFVKMDVKCGQNNLCIFKHIYFKKVGSVTRKS